MRIGDRVFINDPNADYHGETGTIIATDPDGSFPYQVRMTDGDFWFTTEEVSATDPTSRGNSHDFDRGFGIGGLGRHEETPIIPSAEAMKRVEQMEQRAHRCKRCGCSDIFDGAMFTTDPDSGLCDDCYG